VPLPLPLLLNTPLPLWLRASRRLLVKGAAVAPGASK
jgi:hypothetical protein